MSSKGFGNDKKEVQETKESSILDDYKTKVWMEGWLQKEGHRVKNWKKRYFVLRGGKLYYFASDKKLDSERKGTFDILGCEVRYLGERNDNEEEEEGNDSDEETKKVNPPGTPSTPVAKDKEAPSTPVPITPQPSQKQESTKKGGFIYKFIIEAVGEKDHELVCAAQDEDEAKLWVRIIANAIEIESYFASCEQHGTKALIGVVRVLTDHNMKDLVIKDEILTIDSVKALSDVIGKNKALSKLTLSNCQVSDSFMKVITNGIAQNDSLVSLDLSNNRISDAGINDLLPSLYINVSITKLNLSNNLISDEGAYYIADLLKSNVAIEYLDLSKNNIGPDGCKYISNALADTSITELELGNNKIGDKGMINLSNGLKSNKHVRNFIKINYLVT